jgi:hypothetical protein
MHFQGSQTRGLDGEFSNVCRAELEACKIKCDSVLNTFNTFATSGIHDPESNS